MLVCVANDCVAPAKWKARFASKPAVHWGDAEQLLELELCFCDRHRLEASLENFFTPGARRAMDTQFVARRLAPPDWTRSELRFVAIEREAQKRALFTYTVYQDPTDYPGKFVVRKHAAAGGDVFAQELVAVGDSLEEVRAKIPTNQVRMPRNTDDDAKIIEVWI